MNKKIYWFSILIFTMFILAGCHSNKESKILIEEEMLSSVVNTDNNSTNAINHVETNLEIQKSKEIIKGNLEIHFIDVGQADSILIKDNNNVMLIDAGNNDDSELIKNYLLNQKIKRIDYLIGTHPHEDHIGSLDMIINNFDIGTIIMPNKITNTKTFEDVITAIENKKLQITEPKGGNKYLLGDAEFTILAPAKDYGDDLNESSVVIKLEYGNNSFIFTGDAGIESEKDMLNSNIMLKADVLKVGHHGSSTATSQEFLAEVAPKYGVIMCEKGNSYGHPHKETLDKLSKANVILYRTDEQGTIIATSDGQNITWETKRVSQLKSNNEIEILKLENNNNIQAQQVPEKENEIIYVLNTNTKKFHYSSCSSSKKIATKNKDEFTGNRDELIKLGYSPCGNCKP